jgi:hypothetical protein
MRPSGLILPGYRSFREVVHPLAAGVAPCFWVIDDQQGPFDSRWLYASPENEALVEKKLFDAPACRNTSSSCWRPHTFPRLAEHVYVDEWTYFFAMRCSDEEVPQRAEWVVRHIGKLTGDFFGHLSQVAELFLFHADGWWELYTSDVEWRQRFRDSFPESFERSWQRAGDPPGEP